MIELLQAIGLDDISAAAWGFVVGATLVGLWVSAWFVGESILDQLLAPDFDADVDQAVHVGNDVAAKNVEAYERLGRSANR